jgi:hypothetical protein
MQKTRRMLSNINVINLILAGVLLLFLYHAVLPVSGKPAKITVPVPKKQTAASAPAADKPAEIKLPSPADYVVIADQNLFHPERKIPVEKKEAAAAPLPKPEFVLYGTLLTDDLHIAYMEDKKAPQNSPTRGNKQIPLKLGESLSGFTLKEIDTDKVVMVRGEEKIDVFLSDTKARDGAAGMPVAQRAATPGARPSLPSRVPAADTRTMMESTPAQPGVPLNQPLRRGFFRRR